MSITEEEYCGWNGKDYIEWIGNKDEAYAYIKYCNLNEETKQRILKEIEGGKE
jgi:hypothetical protein